MTVGAILCAVLCLTQSAPQEPKLQAYTGPKKRAIVTRLEIKAQGVSMYMPTPSGRAAQVLIDIPQPDDFGDGLADMLITALIDSKRFVVLERNDLNDILDEQKLSSSPDVDPKSAAKVGKLLGAQVIVRGSVTEISYKKSSTGADGLLGGAIGAGETDFSATVVIDLKIIDVATGQVLDSVKAEGKAGSKSRFIGLAKDDLVLGKSTFDSSPLGKAVRAAINSGVTKICERTEKIPWQARVAKVEPKDDGTIWLYLNAGEKAGLTRGMVLQVCKEGEAIVDPDTLLEIGRSEDKVIGSCRIETVKPELSIAVLTTSGAVEVRDLVRLPPPPKPADKGLGG